MVCGVYCIRNTLTNDLYVGSSVDVKQRWRGHRYKLRHNKANDSLALTRAWTKYGEASFVFELLEECERDVLVEREQYYIDTLKPRYNARKKAETNFGLVHSPESRAKMGRPKKLYVIDGIKASLYAHAKRYGVVTIQSVYHRLKQGWPVEDAVKTPPTPSTKRYDRERRALKRRVEIELAA